MRSGDNAAPAVPRELAAALNGLIAARINEAFSHLDRPRVAGAPPPPAAPVDVIIPVHDAFDDFRRCLESVLAYTGEAHRIVLIDDASSDARVCIWMREQAARDARIVLRLQDCNLGYLRSVNAAMAASDRDVVLLNSDTLVGPDWLDRLSAAAHSADDVGIACPLSDAATLLSVVEPAKIADLSPQGLRDLIAHSAVAGWPRLPTAVGFCMYVRRRVLDAIGGFDPAFDPGYGEENDFSMRAWQANFAIVACPDVLVRHVGGRSFGHSDELVRRRSLHGRLLAARWPGYETLVRDWWRDWPLRETSGRIASALSGERKRVLHVLHRLHRLGGTELHVKALAQALQSHVDCTVVAPVRADEAWADMTPVPGYGVDALSFNEAYVRPNQRVRGSGADLSDPGVERQMLRLIAGRRYDVVHVHSLLHWNSLLLPLLACEAGARVVLTLHSLEALCADFTLVPPALGLACGKRFGGADDDCLACLGGQRWQRSGVAVPDIATYHAARRHAWAQVLASADVIVAPSNFVRERIAAAFGPALADRIEIIPHGLAHAPRSLQPRAIAGENLRVGFFGGYSQVKGADVLIALARMPVLSHIRFELHGCADFDELPADLPPNLAVSGPYPPDRLDERLVGLDLVLLPSQGEETFSLLLSGCRAAGVPVAASALGAFVERVRNGVDGWLLPPRDIEAWRDLLLRLSAARGRAELDAVRAALASEAVRTIDENAADYARIYERLSSSTGRARRKPAPHGPLELASRRLMATAGALRPARLPDDPEPPRPMQGRASLCVLIRADATNIDLLPRTLCSLDALPIPLQIELLLTSPVDPRTLPATLAITCADDVAAVERLGCRLLRAEADWQVVLDAGDELSPRVSYWLVAMSAQDLAAFWGDYEHAHPDGHRYAPVLQEARDARLAMGAAQGVQGLFVHSDVLRRIGGWRTASPALRYEVELKLLRMGAPMRAVGQVLLHRADRHLSPAQSDAVLAAHRGVAELHRQVLGLSGRIVANGAGPGWRFEPCARPRRTAVRVWSAASAAAAEAALAALRVSGIDDGIDLGTWMPDAPLPPCERLVLLRADLRPTQPNWLARLLAWLEIAGIALVAPRRTGARGEALAIGYAFDGSSLQPIADPRAQPGLDVTAIADGVRAVPALSNTCLALDASRAMSGQIAGLLDADPLRAFAAQQALRAGGQLLWVPAVEMRQSRGERARAVDVDGPQADALIRRGLADQSADGAMLSPLTWRRRPLRGAAACVKQRPRVSALSRDRWASTHYRVVQPLADLTFAGRIEAPALWRARLEPMPGLFELAQQQADVVLFHHCLSDDALALMSACARHLPAVRRLLLIDDLVTAVPASNPMAARMPQDIAQRLRRALDLCDVLITTTHELAHHYRPWARSVRIIENALSESRWFEPKVGDERERGRRRRLRVGWAGAQQHEADLALIETVVRRRADLQWVFMGMAPRSAAEVGAEIHPMVPLEEYPRRLATLDLDIALVPLADNAFNRCKSALKLMELGAVRVAVVASDLPPYRNAPVMRVGDAESEWLVALDALTASDDARFDAAAALHEWVRMHHRQAHRRPAWLQALGLVNVQEGEET